MKLSDFIGEATEYDKKEILEERKPKSWLKSQPSNSVPNHARGRYAT